MIKIVIINAVYPPEPLVSSQLGRDLATYLAQSGLCVTVLCPYPSRPLGAEYKQFQFFSGTSISKEYDVEVVRLPSFKSPQSKFLSRIRESSSFGWHVCRYLEKQLSKVDVIYANTWPMASQALIARYCTKHRIPLVLHIQDLYPESLLSKLPGFSYRLIETLLIAIDRWLAKQSTKVVTISEKMKQRYLMSRNLVPNKVVVVENWLDESQFEQLPKRSVACAHYGISEELFTFLYLGNIGPVAGVEILIDAFHTAHLSKAQLVIAGDGSAKASCIEHAKSLKVRNVRFISDPDVVNVPLLQSIGHVCLLPMRKGTGASSIPSKLMAYLFSAKPVLAAVDEHSDTAECIQHAQCGWVGEPEKVDWLARKMSEVAALPMSVLNSIGQHGRAYGLEHFSKLAGVKKFGQIVLQAVKTA